MTQEDKSQKEAVASTDTASNSEQNEMANGGAAATFPPGSVSPAPSDSSAPPLPTDENQEKKDGGDTPARSTRPGGVAPAPDRALKQKKHSPAKLVEHRKQASSGKAAAYVVDIVIKTPKIIKTLTHAPKMKNHPFETHLYALKNLGWWARHNNPYAAWIWELTLLEIEKMAVLMRSIKSDAEKVRRHEQAKNANQVTIRLSEPKRHGYKVTVKIFNKLMYESTTLIPNLDALESQCMMIARCGFPNSNEILEERDKAVKSIRNFWHKTIGFRKLLGANELQNLTVEQLKDPAYQEKIKLYEEQLGIGPLPEKYYEGTFFTWVKDGDEYDAPDEII